MTIYTIGTKEEKCGGMQSLYTEVSVKEITHTFGDMLIIEAGFPPMFHKKEDAEQYMKTFVGREDLCIVEFGLL